MDSMNKHSRIYVAGHKGLVGSAIVRTLECAGYGNLIVRTRQQADLRDRATVDRLFAEEKPEFVFLAAARVGGILANSTQPADFIFDNLAVEINVVDSAFRHGVKKLEFLGSSCIYPKHAEQPMREDALLTGPLEPTNEWYAIAKIAGIKLCQAYWRQYGFRAISLMPTNLYGPGDNFDLATSHVLPALIRKFHDAKEQNAETVTLWGTGSAKREFLHVDDLAGAAVHLMETYEDAGIVNVGSGQELTIRDLALLIAGEVGYRGRVDFDSSKPDGAMRKLLDNSRMRGLGWTPRIELRQGIADVYAWYLQSRQLTAQ